MAHAAFNSNCLCHLILTIERYACVVLGGSEHRFPENHVVRFTKNCNL